MRRYRPLRSGGRRRAGDARARSISSLSVPKRRSSPASPTRCALRAFAVFGPSAAAAQLEGSKGFTKDLCRANGIPTADYVRTETRGRRARSARAVRLSRGDQGRRACRRQGRDGRHDPRRGRSGDRRDAATAPLVIEEFLTGEEASLFALVDGETAVPLASAQDHKRVGEGDTGPNTGGMGAYAPAPVLTRRLQQRAMDEIVRPTARRAGCRGNAVQRRALCRADAHRRRTQADRI